MHMAHRGIYIDLLLLIFGDRNDGLRCTYNLTASSCFLLQLQLQNFNNLLAVTYYIVILKHIYSNYAQHSLQLLLFTFKVTVYCRYICESNS